MKSFREWFSGCVNCKRFIARKWHKIKHACKSALSFQWHLVVNRRTTLPCDSLLVEIANVSQITLPKFNLTPTQLKAFRSHFASIRAYPPTPFIFQKSKPVIFCCSLQHHNKKAIPARLEHHFCIRSQPEPSGGSPFCQNHKRLSSIWKAPGGIPKGFRSGGKRAPKVQNSQHLTEPWLKCYMLKITYDLLASTWQQLCCSYEGRARIYATKLSETQTSTEMACAESQTPGNMQLAYKSTRARWRCCCEWRWQRAAPARKITY